MSAKLWTAHFARVCIANLLLFASFYILFPVLPVEMEERLVVPTMYTGFIFLFFIAGMFLIGPFQAYLIDAFKRKYVYLFSCALMMAATVGYTWVTDVAGLLVLCVLQGLAFGMATTTGITLAIDVTNTSLRSKGNIRFFWIARFGTVLGIILGVGIYQMSSFENVVITSALMGGVSMIVILPLYVPFRAPIVTKVVSLDRFLLLKGWVPFINMILITFVPGLLIPMVYSYYNDLLPGSIDIPIPFFVGVAGGYLLALTLSRLSFLKEHPFGVVLVGLGLEILALSVLYVGDFVGVSSLLLGMGLGFVIPLFLLFFVQLSNHCQRGTGNTTHLLAIEVGISLGIVVACYLEKNTNEILNVGSTVAVVAFLFFLSATYPYYKKMKVR